MSNRFFKGYPMNSDAVRARIREFIRIKKDAGGDETALLEVALFVEDVFGIILTDKDICEENLGTHRATEKFVLEKLGLRKPCAESVESST